MASHARPFSRYATRNRLLREDVASMITDWALDHPDKVSAAEVAKDIVTVVRERVLQEIESYARQNIR